MNADETAAYVRARIAPAGARGNRFDADTLARLYGATGGVPRRVHELGSAIWRSPDDADLPALVEGWVRGDEGREAEPAIVAIETDEPGEPVERIEPGEPAEDEPGEAERAAAGQTPFRAVEVGTWREDWPEKRDAAVDDVIAPMVAAEAA